MPLIKDLLGFGKTTELSVEVKERETKMESGEPIEGKIIKLSEEGGWGFISSKEIPFTRIFFHWTSLSQDTLNFTELKKGMMVSFIPVEKEGRGWSANKIKVVPKE